MTLEPATSGKGVVLEGGAGKAVTMRGAHFVFKAEGRRAAGGPTVAEFTVEPGTSTGDHVHTSIEEAFYVLEGELQLRVGDQLVTAKPGDFVLIPPGVAQGSATSARHRARPSC